MKIFTPFFYILVATSFFLLLGMNAKAQVYTQAESAEYDVTQNRWLVSNGNIIARASDGTLSIFGNASANYGMEILGDHLFAINGSRIMGYNLATADEVMNLNIGGSGFLNGMANDGVDKIYVTDFQSSKIYEIDVADLNNPSFTTIVESVGTTPNGIIFDGDNDRLLVTSWQSSNAPIKAISLSDFSVSDVVTTNVGNIDGIARNNEGSYYISSWSPARITKYNADFSSAPETITTPFISNPADIGYALATDTLAIPIATDVVFVGFNMVSATEELYARDYRLTVFPNPIQNQSIIQFSLTKAEEVSLTLMDSNGRKVATLLSGIQNAGRHTVSMAGHQLVTGQYSLLLRTKDGLQDVVPVLLAE